MDVSYKYDTSLSYMGFKNLPTTFMSFYETRDLMSIGQLLTYL